jgi:hypothetical protein
MENSMKNKIKHFIAKLLFGKPMFMSVYQDKYGNKFGGSIHKEDGWVHIDDVKHIEEPQYLGEIKIYR